MGNEIVATLWIGPELRWLEQLSLSSFIRQGHRVKLYAYNMVEGLPFGVELADATTIWNPPRAFLDSSGPALIADIFRLHLMKKTDEIWVDSDMVAIAPFTRSSDGYAVGFEATGKVVNNAVLRLPPDSPALNALLHFVDNPTPPDWLRRVHRKTIANTPPDARLQLMHKIRRASMGPMALSHMIKSHGEMDQILPRDTYYPVPWPFTDVLFSPHGGVEGWLSPQTQGIHLWSNLIRAHHKKNLPDSRSFIGRLYKSHADEFKARAA